MSKPNHLSLKNARRLALRELGTAAGLVRTKDADPGFFEMSLGRLKVHIRPDRLTETGCVELSVSDGRESIVRLFDHHTLGEDTASEECRKELLLQDALER